ncbi:hypothetical protein Q7C36_018571 [Tachysurus vachellii]|uniref:Immunoglobulin V-set domain-containing protein n=1 Tax=Tachysurus vachellii TaxID=175792 RepID=A0AA88M0A6_TACVA|nr:uncharacterized protein cd8b [Tachysurus vachellii]KAK2827645.1 hypothetical protein Q7C36_018571 [Tachysurus vachellii]
MTLNHIWSFICFLTAASAVTVSYPSINGSETLTCCCPDHQCLKAYWYRLLQGSDTPEFILFINSVNTLVYAENIDKKRFKAFVADSGKMCYTLRISGLQKQDAGFYSCVLNSQNSIQNPKDLMPDGHVIWPGVIISTPAPTAVKNPKRMKPPNRCKSSNQSPKGCKSLVLWPGIGTVLLLVVVLISTLYYYSRLPKKCRHHFVKTRQLS